jgi:hypothetical protein
MTAYRRAFSAVEYLKAAATGQPVVVVGAHSRGKPGEIAAFVASMREDATRLRQSSPFTNLLTPEERARIFEAFR